MKTLTQAGIFFCIAYILNSCGLSGGQDKAAPAVKTFDLRAPLTYQRADSRCKKDAARVPAGVRKVHSWGSQGPEVESYSFGTKTIEDALFNYHSVTKISSGCEDLNPGSWPTSQCAGEANELSGPQALLFCSDSDDYPRHSIEGVALSSWMLLEKAAKFFYKLEPEHKLPKLSLLTLPRFEYMAVTKDPESGNDRPTRLTITDNAAWSKFSDGSYLFIIYPRSEVEERRASSATTPSLWEVPWVLSHEFGHHIYDSYVTLPQPYASLVRHRSLDSQRLRSYLFLRQRAVEADYKLAGTLLELEAVGEAHADVYAWLSRQESSADLNNVSVLSGRAPETAYFDAAKAVPKSISTKVVDRLWIGGKALCLDAADECNINLNDSHQLGAILAHGAVRFFAAAENSSPEQRQRAFIAWTQNMAKVYAKVKTTRSGAVILGAVTALVSTSRVGDKQLNGAECQVLKEVFGGLFASSKSQELLGSYGCR